MITRSFGIFFLVWGAVVALSDLMREGSPDCLLGLILIVLGSLLLGSEKA